MNDETTSIGCLALRKIVHDIFEEINNFHVLLCLSLYSRKCVLLYSFRIVILVMHG